MRRELQLAAAVSAAVLTLATTSAQTLILDRTHFSQVFHETRHYRIFLPSGYEATSKRYPVIYWFHGFGERYNKGPAGKEYDQGNDYQGDNLANFVAKNDVIVVKWDGYNPRTPNEDDPRPYNIGPVETDRQFPLYFPELVAYIDANYRTIADREHRATSGLSMGGFMSFWIAGKYPDLVSSASNFMGSPEFVVGPKDFPVEYSHDVMSGNYAGVRTRLVTGSQDFIQFYHRQMNLIWRIPTHETENFDFDHGTPGMAKTLQFHMNAFAHPLPRPESWSHADVYPKFSVWGWTIETDRHQPGFTVIDYSPSSGFKYQIREWLPGGKLLTNVHIKITPSAHLAPAPAPEPRQSWGGQVLMTFQISDHRPMPVFQHAVQIQTLTLGQGNGDGKANYGEQIAILIADGTAYRAAELFSTDPCLDLTTRVSDNWGEYDWVGASAKYTLAKINCPAGYIAHLSARVLIPHKPNHEVRDAKIDFKVAP
jgi:pimeloyl-ACP methyl ester carboxylesterase